MPEHEEDDDGEQDDEVLEEECQVCHHFGLLLGCGMSLHFGRHGAVGFCEDICVGGSLGSEPHGGGGRGVDFVEKEFEECIYIVVSVGMYIYGWYTDGDRDA